LIKRRELFHLLNTLLTDLDHCKNGPMGARNNEWFHFNESSSYLKLIGCNIVRSEIKKTRQNLGKEKGMGKNIFKAYLYRIPSTIPVLSINHLNEKDGTNGK